MPHVDTRTNQHSIADFVQWHKQGLLELSPRFQRRPNWSKGAKSYLIDTILKGLPLPLVILREQPTNLESLKTVREVVDGQQRLRTILSFVDPKRFPTDKDQFTIRKAHSEEYGGMKFAELPEQARRDVLKYPITVHLLDATVSDQDVLEIFSRLNATGTSLNEQELRNAEFYGYFKTIAFKLALEYLEFWRKSGVFGESDIARMREVEMTSELMVLVKNGIAEGGKKTLDDAYEEFELKFPARAIVAKKVQFLLDYISEHTDFDAIPRMRNRPLFYCLCAALCKLAFGLPPRRNTPKLVTSADWDGVLRAAKRLSDGKAPLAIMKLTERRTSHRHERGKLVEFLTS